MCIRDSRRVLEIIEMNELILVGIQIVTSIWEVWMCYQLLFITVFDRNNITKRERFVMYCIVVLVGSVLGLNRCGVFFSSKMCIRDSF